MRKPIPTLAKTPFILDTRPLMAKSSPHAGLLATSRVFRSLGLPDLISSTISIKERKRGLEEAQLIEALVLLQTAGGECVEDIKIFSGDDCLERGLGYAWPKVNTVRDFLERFRDEALEQSRPSRELQKSFIMPPSESLQGLQEVLAGSVRSIAQVMEREGRPQTIATVDQDATIIESHKAAAYAHYNGGRGYQPMVAVWAEANLVLASEFRDGNVPARQEPLTCARLAFTSLPDTVTERYFRGDSGCYERCLLGWLNSPERAKEKGGRIGFCVSAAMSPGLAEAVAKVDDQAWKTFGHDPDGTLRQWADIDYLPSEPYEGKTERAAPLRYVGLRLLKSQGCLFADGSDRLHFAVVTNLDWTGDRLLPWHREKAGTIEHVHDEVKNGLGGGHLPSQHIAANAAWFAIALLAFNLASAIKDLCFDSDNRSARMKRYRLLCVHLSGRMSLSGNKLKLRFHASKEAIARIFKIWEVFALPTHPSVFY